VSAILPHAVFAGDCLGLPTTVPARSCRAAIFDPPAELGFMGLRWDRLGGGEAFRDWLAERVAACRPLVAEGGWWIAWAHPKTGDWTAQALRRAGLTIEGEVVQLVAEGRPRAGFLAPGHERWILAWSGRGRREPLHLDEWRPVDGREPRSAWIASGYAEGLDRIIGPRRSGAYTGARRGDAERPGARSTYGGFGGTPEGRGRAASTGGISRFFPGVRDGEEVPPLLLVGPKCRHAHRDLGPGLGRTAHETAKSPQLVAPLVALASRPGDAVLDITAGGGGIPHACAALGRRAVAAELSRASAREIVIRLGALGGEVAFAELPGAVC
jgi:hypothetical protein